MTGTSLVATARFYNQAGDEYVFPTHDVLVAANIYNAWAEQAKNHIYPVRVQMAKENWALFRSFYLQFRLSSNKDIQWVSEDLAEEGIIHAAIKRLEDPVWREGWLKGIKEMTEYLSHEPAPKPFRDRWPHLAERGL